MGGSGVDELLEYMRVRSPRLRSRIPSEAEVKTHACKSSSPCCCSRGVPGAGIARAEDRPNDSLYAGLSTDELLQRHQDYLQALIWAQATAFSDDDEALAAMSRRYTFHSA